MKKLNVVRNPGAGSAEPQRLGPPRPESRVAKAVVQRGSQFWRSLEDKIGSVEAEVRDTEADSWREFPKGADTLEVPRDGVSRRRFFGVMGSGAALAGMSLGTNGCLRKPKEHIMPFGERPEDIVPGKPLYYATAYQFGGSVEGVLVESQDGRPTKIEGNPKHSGSQGATSVYTQAAILDLYDPDRSRVPLKDITATPAEGEAKPEEVKVVVERPGEAEGSAPAKKLVVDWGAAKAGLSGLLKSKGQGKGLAFVVPTIMSPTSRRHLSTLGKKYPQAKIFLCDPWAPQNAVAAAEAFAGPKARVRTMLDEARVVFAADADFFGREPDSTRLSREWASLRRIVGPTDHMSRLYAAEPHMSNTGVMADHRVRVKASQVGDVLLALAKALVANDTAGLMQPLDGLDLSKLPDGQVDDATRAMVGALSKDMIAHIPVGAPEAEQKGLKESKEQLNRRTGSAIVVGQRQPAWVHALGIALGYALGSNGRSMRWSLRNDPDMGSTADLAKALSSNAVDTVICWGTNPAFDAEGDLGMPGLLANATVVHMGTHRDETAALASWHLPVSHFLETWSDLESSDTTVTICQPLIEPLHGTHSLTELLAFMVSGKMERSNRIIQREYKRVPGFSDRTWRQWLHEGVASGIPGPTNLPEPKEWGKLQELLKGRTAPAPGMEVNVNLDPKVADGRFSNNAWMQELPDPLTKMTWDNVAALSPATAAQLGVENGTMVSVTVDGAAVELPAFIAPGQADDTVGVTLGYGRNIADAVGGMDGVLCKGIGTNVAALRRASAGGWFAAGSVAATGADYKLATTQDYGSMKPPVYKGVEYPERPIVLEATRDEFNEDPNFVEKANLMEPARLKHLWDPPKLTGKQQWGLSVDLNSCTGCNACVIACQAENNIPVVGKDRVLMGREMHWMRIDRYYRGEDVNNPTAVMQPMLCQQCESAPCETVCPVAATTHSPEGLNDMAYNRCIGTRYCSNNCPYKVRRYNFFNYNMKLRAGGYIGLKSPEAEQLRDVQDDDAWLRQMQKNPDVTVRFRGVMEKCTYCVQRINGAKIEAHVAGKDVVEDGEILTACQQVCPTGALVFGDIRDPDSAVSKAKRSPRDYSVLRDLNTHPRTTYLARIRNPHPDLV